MVPKKAAHRKLLLQRALLLLQSLSMRGLQSHNLCCVPLLLLQHLSPGLPTPGFSCLERPCVLRLTLLGLQTEPRA